MSAKEALLIEDGFSYEGDESETAVVTYDESLELITIAPVNEKAGVRLVLGLDEWNALADFLDRVIPDIDETEE
jgi:hypothetical protein